MGTITVSDIFNKAKQDLFDENAIRWLDTHKLALLNEGQRALVAVKWNAYVKNSNVITVAGTKQTLPTDAIQLVDIPLNMGTNGSTPGKPITKVSRRSLDFGSPGWHYMTADAVTQHYVYEVEDIKTFYVYPPQPTTGQGYLRLVYAAVPADTTANGVITLDDIYEPALVFYLLYRCFAKDTEFAADQGRAAAYWQAFVAAVSGKVQAEATAQAVTNK